MTRRPRAALLAAALVVAGCGAPGTAVRIWGVERMGPGFAATLTTPPVAVEIIGASPETTAAVAERMRMPGRLGGGPFAPAGPEAGRGARLVIAPGGGAARCTGAGAPGTGRPEAEALWCLGDRRLARARGSAAAFADPAAPGFAAAASRLAAEVMRPEQDRRARR